MNLELSERDAQITRNHKFVPTKRVDYKDCVCVKPWGHEFLAYESTSLGIWCLTIRKGHATSLHCHFKKDTIMFVLSGCAKMGLIDGETLSLPVGSCIRIPKRKFHSVGSFSDETTILEVEVFTEDATFSDKNDLLRIDDQYVREKTGYARSIEVDRELAKYNHFWLGSDVIININDTELTVETITEPKYAEGLLLEGTVYVDGHYVREGSLVKSVVSHCKVLSIKHPYADEDAKIIYSIEHLKCVCKSLSTKKIVLTSGCFDIVHVGHMHNLKYAKQHGDVLMVCLSSDAQIAALKGQTRPVNACDDRLNLFKTISYVDYIVLYDEANLETEETLDTIMRVVDPDVWVKGSDYNPGAVIEKHPSLRNVSIIPNIPNKSTTNIVQKLLLKSVETP